MQTFNFAWEKVDGATEYILYKAVGDVPVYTQIGKVNSNDFSYSVPQAEQNLRTTFVVTAVNANGIQSNRVLCYFNPIV